MIGKDDMSKVVSYMSGSIITYVGSVKERRVAISISRIKNLSSDHIDTMMIADGIAVELVKKGIPLIDRPDSPVNATAEQSLLVLSGSVHDITDYSGDYCVVQYVFSLKLVNPVSHKVEWMDSVTIEKRFRRERISY